MVIAVTGATGFVGRHVMHQLASSGRLVRILVRDPAKWPATVGVDVIAGDLHDAKALARLCERASTVLHIAGAISGSAHHMEKVNAAGTSTLLAAADHAAVGRFIHVSSLAAREPEISAYASSKAQAEAAVQGAPRTLQTLVIRPPAVYGEGDTATLPLLKALTAKTAILPGSAAARFSLIHVQDLARILVAAIDSNVVGLREVDDGHGAYSWHEVVDVLRAMTGRPHRVFFLPRPVASLAGHAADVVTAITGKSLMLTAGKIRELYHPDWATRPPGWPRANATSLANGMFSTLSHAMAHGLLPPLPLADRSPKHDT